jgi:hypothetical protein
LIACFEQAVKDAGMSNSHSQDLRLNFVTRLRATKNAPPLRMVELERNVAERVGFEPTVELPPLRFSRPVH